MIKLADLQAQHLELEAEIGAAINRVIRSSQFIGGKEVADFEAAFANYIGTEYCLGCGNGTDALEIAISALALPTGSEIIVQANSFIASAEAIINTGHVPVFADCNERDYSIELEGLEALITEKTAALIVVHLYGYPADMTRVMQFARKHRLRVIEDCAQAHGAKWCDQTVGSFGDVSTFSFFPGKNLGAMGDGGAICTSQKDLYLHCKKIANHGRLSKFDHEIVGRNSRLDTLQAAILLVKLGKLEAWNSRRRLHAKEISELVSRSNDDLILPRLSKLAEPVFHQLVIRSIERKKAIDKLSCNGIEVGIHYPKAICEYGCYQLDRGDVSTSIALAKTIFSVPVHQHLDDEQIRHIGVNLL